MLPLIFNLSSPGVQRTFDMLVASFLVLGWPGSLFLNSSMAGVWTRYAFGNDSFREICKSGGYISMRRQKLG